MSRFKDLAIIILIVISTTLAFRGCKKDLPKIKVKEKTNLSWIRDSIRECLISSIKPVYIDTGSVKYVKGKTLIKWRDSIVYVEKESNTTIKANIFDAKISSNKATADLKVTTTGELLGVDGTINYPEKTIEREVTKYVSRSGLFIFAQTDYTLDTYGLGLDFIFKNNIEVGVSALNINSPFNNDFQQNRIYVLGKVGMKL